MDKIFLSHSSHDKPYVKYIAEQLGKDRCVYDEFCFEAGMKTIDEIFREMDHCSIFVIFLSDAALNSEWVQKELAMAEDRLHHDAYRLSQIFPIIVDPDIRHDDARIPAFLRSGGDAYNLRIIPSNRVALRKIEAQQARLLLESGAMARTSCFYGRSAEIAEFKNSFDTGHPIRCLIASGLPGVGRGTYLRACLRDSHIIPPYYQPPTLSLAAMDGIEDLIMKLAQLGFLSCALEQVTALPDMEAKIALLAEALTAVQNYNEQVLIYDEGCLVDRTGDVAYWFLRALGAIRSEVTVMIAARTKVHPGCLKRNDCLFAIELSTLPRNEWMGLMRVYAGQVGIALTREDIDYFRDVITGYPPQVLYAVDRMRETSVAEVREDTHTIATAFTGSIAKTLAALLPDDDEQRQDVYGFLSFLCTYGIVPTDLIHPVTGIKEGYRRAFSLLKQYTVCRYLGLAHEYVEVNGLVSDHIRRNRIPLPADIQHVLNARAEKVRAVVDAGGSTLAEDFEDLKYYLKRNLIRGMRIPDRFTYATLYLSSLGDLYNAQKYGQVISLTKGLKESGAFDRYDEPVRDRIQSYYCRSLAREKDRSFYKEVEYFAHAQRPDRRGEYEFLRGFMYRNEARYDKALPCFQHVLEIQHSHRSAMREIVTVYRGLEDYESAYTYARDNYHHDAENLYHIQPYFEILIHKDRATLSDRERQDIKEIIDTVTSLLPATSSAAAYEILGLYAAFVEEDLPRAVDLLTVGAEHHPDSFYVVKYLFDCYEHFQDRDGMREALARLEAFRSGNTDADVAYRIREAVWYAYEGRAADFIHTKIQSIPSFNPEARERLIRKTDLILHRAAGVPGR